MPLTKTAFVQQPVSSPSCFGCAAAMAAGVTLEDFVAVIGRDATRDRKGYSLKEVSQFLMSQDMTFVPAGFLYNVIEKEEVPGAMLNVKIDADTLEVLEGYAEKIGMSVDAAVNGILTRALTKHGARSREGYRYVDTAGYPGGEIHNKFKTTGHLKYVSNLRTPAIVVTKTNSESNHAVYWDGQFLWDSAIPEICNPVPIEKYTVVAWHQVGRFEHQSISPTQLNFLAFSDD
jgi:hypothetical protein